MYTLGGGRFGGPKWHLNSCPFDAIRELFYLFYDTTQHQPSQLLALVRQRKLDKITEQQYQNNIINLLTPYINERYSHYSFITYDLFFKETEIIQLKNIAKDHIQLDVWMFVKQLLT